MNIYAWIVFGVVIGWLIGRLYKAMNLFYYILIGILIGLTVGYIMQSNEHYTTDCSSLNGCVYSHDQNGLDYIWLTPKYGKLLTVEYEEPANSGNWKGYDEKVWEIHCKVISHDPDKLKDAHIKAFINPDTRFARLRFTFNKNGKVYTMEPNEEFYELEQEFFKKHADKLGCPANK